MAAVVAFGAALGPLTYGLASAWAVVALSALVLADFRREPSSLAVAAVRATRRLVALAPFYAVGALVAVALFALALASVEGTLSPTTVLALWGITLGGLLVPFAYVPFALADGLGPLEAVSRSLEVARRTGWPRHVLLCAALAGCMLMGLAAASVGLVVSVTVADALLGRWYVRYVPAARERQVAAGPWLWPVTALLNGLTIWAIVELTTSLPPPQDLGPSVEPAAAPVTELEHPSGERTVLSPGEPAVLERVAPDGSPRPSVTLSPWATSANTAMAVSGEGLAEAAVEPNHFVTFGLREADLSWSSHMTVALFVRNVRAVRLRREPDGYAIDLWVDGWLGTGLRRKLVRVPDGTTRQRPESWLANMAPRRSSPLDLFYGAWVLVPAFGPCVTLGAILAGFRRRWRSSAAYRPLLWSLLAALLSATVMMWVMGVGL